MSWILIVEQALNGLQFGLMLFLLAAGLTLVFGIMDIINLAHGSPYMLGAFLAATLVQATRSFARLIMSLMTNTSVRPRYAQHTSELPSHSDITFPLLLSSQ